VRIPTNRVTLAGLLVAIGIIYGDIGTSPLYVFGAIIKGKEISEELILGGLSCIIWTLTLQTTIKYVILTLRADNNGEGGMFSLFALVRRHGKWAVIPAMMGGAAVLSEGIITPPISVTSAIEGLKQIKLFSDIGQWTIVGIVLFILVILFFLQQFGTSTIGRFFGPVMLVWFTMLAVLGLGHILDDVKVLKAFNPYYAINLLTQYPRGFWILGAVFLCTTGAEALYSDLGHCGRSNIRMSWIFVKSSLILNYLGQGAWLLNHVGSSIDPNINPFYALMPEGFRLIGILIATAATIVASQALISGSFTLISEAMRLNLWSKLKINYPTEEKGQLFIPAVNMLLFLGCCGVVLYFQKGTKHGSSIRSYYQLWYADEYNTVFLLSIYTKSPATVDRSLSYSISYS
jgi:KUP system potassium uptake protein